MNCPAIPTGADAHISAALASIDCQVSAGIEASYGRLFTAGGALSTALTALMTIYIGILAFGFITGRTHLSLSAVAPKVLALGLTLTFVTSWPAYHAVIYQLLSGGPDQIAASLMGARAGAVTAFAQEIDDILVHFLGAMGSLAAQEQAHAAPANLHLAQTLTQFSGIALLLSTVGLLVVARIVLALMLGVGPIFIVLAMFGATRGLFEGWLRTTVAFALAPMLIVLGGVGALGALGPLIASIESDAVGAVENLRSIVLLFCGTVVYLVLLAALIWAAASLTRGWRIGLSAAVSSGAVDAAVLHATSRDRAGAVAANSAISDSAAGDHRLQQIVVAIDRNQMPSAAPVSTTAAGEVAHRLMKRPAVTPAGRGHGDAKSRIASKNVNGIVAP